MTTPVAAGLTLVLGVLLGAAAMRLYAGARLAALGTESDLLRERVLDLETMVSEDAQTAAALLPLRDTLTRVEAQVGSLERDRVDQFASLRAVMTRVEGETQTLSRQTASLAGSLNASTVRGAWGEVQLRRVLEAAGLLARCDFDEQVGAVSRHDRVVRPDVVLRLPGSKVLVVDAKAPMSAFLAAQGEDLEDRERAALLAEHATALRRHVTTLAGKDYWSAFAVSPEVVVCFVPTDAMLSAALTAAPGLHEEALDRGVALVGPAALLALLKTVAFTWRQDSLTDNARELLALGRELHERLSTLGGHVSTMGRSLQRSVETYNQLVGALETRVLVSARRMNDLGIADQAIDRLEPVQTGPRVLTAMELIESATSADARAQLDFEATASLGEEQRRDAG